LNADRAALAVKVFTMAEHTTYLFAVPQAARLGSLAGIKSDLENVVQYCDRMIERYCGDHLKKSPFDIVGLTTPLDFLDWEALSISACVAYTRCFVSGVRGSLDPAHLGSADNDLRSLHGFIIDMRNKHVAHSVNPFEENQITVQISDTLQSAAEITTIGISHGSRVGFQMDVPPQLKRLASWWLEKVEAEVITEREMLLQVTQNLSLSDIRAFGIPGSGPSAQSNSNVAKRRPSP
jgi:hypothetical protein